jgi:hypothetical protein
MPPRKPNPFLSVSVSLSAAYAVALTVMIGVREVDEADGAGAAVGKGAANVGFQRQQIPEVRTPGVDAEVVGQQMLLGSASYGA